MFMFLSFYILTSIVSVPNVAFWSGMVAYVHISRCDTLQNLKLIASKMTQLWSIGRVNLKLTLPLISTPI